MTECVDKGTVVLTGAGGFVGINASKYLTEQGYQVIGLDINEEALKKIEACGAIGIKCDLLKDDLNKILKDADFLIHIAGLFRFDVPIKKLYQINTKLVDVIMKAASRTQLEHIIHFSTTATYGIPKSYPIMEDFPQKPNDLYGKTKLKGEEIAWKYWRENNLPISIIRPTLIYGPENPFGIALFLAFNSLLNEGIGLKKYINIRKGTYTHLVHVSDVVRISEFLFHKKESIGNAYNVVDDHPLSAGELMETIININNDGECVNIIPYSKKLMKIINKLAKTRVFDFVNPIFNKLWRNLGRRANFNAEKIDLHISPDWLGYFSTDFNYSNKKIHDLGYEFLYPHPKKGLIDNALWYKENKWIP
ncbi:MAG: NAD-dependent epimerase/dehydratase family protein [Promethearchaeota archaeon]